MSKFNSPAELLETGSELISLPDVLFQLQEAIANPNGNASVIGEIISKDPALTARLLKLANSPIYGFGGKIDTVSRAVTLVGVDSLYSLALATCALSKFRNIPTQLIDMDEFWVQSTYCAVVARLLAKEAGVLHPERLFVGGLLHGIGALLLYYKCPDETREILLAAQGKRSLVPLLEKDLLGFTYADVGREIARQWNMPVWLQEAIGLHLEPEKVKEFPLETALVSLAVRLTGVLSEGDAVEDILAEMPTEILEITHLEDSQVEQVMSDVYYEFTEVADLLLSV